MKSAFGPSVLKSNVASTLFHVLRSLYSISRTPFFFGRMLRETLVVLLLWAVLKSCHSRGCSGFFCRKNLRVSKSHEGADPGEPLFLTPYLEKGAIDEARKLSLVGPLPGANVKSYAGYLTVNKKYNSNLYFWFFPVKVH
ncbi:unnamed protein product [Arctogadus glacialis]